MVGICRAVTARQIPTISPAPPRPALPPAGRPPDPAGPASRRPPIGGPTQIETFVTTQDAQLFR